MCRSQPTVAGVAQVVPESFHKLCSTGRGAAAALLGDLAFRRGVRRALDVRTSRGRNRPTRHDRVSCRAMSWRHDQKAALASVATTVEGFVLHIFGNLVIQISVFHLYGFGTYVCSGLLPVQWYHRGLVVFLDTLALGESWCVTCRLWRFGWFPQFFGFTCVVERQLDLTSVTRVLVVVLPVEVCHGVDTVDVVWWYLVVVGLLHLVNQKATQILSHSERNSLTSCDLMINTKATQNAMYLPFSFWSGDVVVSFGARRRRPFLREGPNEFALCVEVGTLDPLALSMLPSP
ncbi:hypothetical protein Taro_026939 [Colocasia esculenta]|uniref:Uncharacterized protein n=1 Tax=Colocasia esculenta TaxID=4460 RepID=A0A843VE97_COLES|nr:hypothetical protein [Colocasia esculenta]